MRVLLIADESVNAQSVEPMLISESINLQTAHLGQEGIDLGKLSDYDIILLDLNRADTFGLDVLRSLRLSKVKTPILISLGLEGIVDKIKGLGFEPGDYIIKPFKKDELVARMDAVVRRSRGTPEVINIGDLSINLDRKTVKVAGVHVNLTGKEYELLRLLTVRRGTTLTKEMFLNHVYGGLDEPNAKIIDVFICKLRRKLADASNGKNYIETVWGRGYMLRQPSNDETQISTYQPDRVSSMGYR